MQIPDFNGASPDSVVLHRALIDHMKEAGNLASPEIEAAFRAVPRHQFLPHLPLEEVYRDQAITTKMISGQFVSSSSQPSMMAIMLAQLQVQSGEHVLEIGAGTGYNAALLAHIVGPTGQVVTIDIDDDIVEQARTNLQRAGYPQVHVLCADGALGYAELAPYDRIILTVNASDIAPAWLEQLTPSGRLLLPLSLHGPQVSVAFDREEDRLVSVSLRGCGFVPLRGSLGESNRAIHLHPHLTLTYIRPELPGSLLGETFFGLLQGSYTELTLPEVLLREQQLFGFVFWLSLRHPAFYELFAHEQFAEADFVPMLFQYTGKNRTRTTIGLLAEHTLCALTWDTASTPILPQSNDAARSDLKIRYYGPGRPLAEELRDQFLAWHLAGYPSEQTIHLTAYSLSSSSEQEISIPVGSQQVTIEKRHTRFLCTW